MGTVYQVWMQVNNITNSIAPGNLLYATSPTDVDSGKHILLSTVKNVIHVLYGTVLLSLVSQQKF